MSGKLEKLVNLIAINKKIKQDKLSINLDSSFFRLI